MRIRLLIRDSPLSPLAVRVTLTLAPRIADFDWQIEAARAEPCLQPRRAAGTVPSAPVIGRSRLEACRERVLAGQCPVRHRDLAPPGYAELLPQDVGVGLGRARGDAKALTDFFVRATCRDQLDDLALPLGDRGKRVPECVVHSGPS